MKRRDSATHRLWCGDTEATRVIDPANPEFTNTPASAERPSFGYVPGDENAVPAVTIVTPFFDTDPAVFAETVLSVQRQSFQQWEWVIADDGSTREDSLAMLADLVESDARIRVVHHERNLGVPVARNTGIANARARFVLQLDSDDLLEPTAAEKWLWFLTSYPEYSFVNGFQVGFGAEQYLWPRGFHEAEAFLTENLTNTAGVARQELFSTVGGFDPDLSGDLEDWQFWLRCAAAGHWGATLAEYLVWYRRRGGEEERWANWDSGPRQAQLLRDWRERYSELWEGGFPRIQPSPTPEGKIDLEGLPFENPLVKSDKRRLLFVVPWAFAGGADKFNIDLVAQLSRQGWETTIVTTLHGDHSWLPKFARLTPDVFALSHFLQPADYPRFLHYVIRSRQPDLILISCSDFAYKALPFLRQVAPGTPVADYCHVVEEYWLAGGHPRLSVDNRELLDLQITASEQVKSWMVLQGADPERIEVCHINIDPEGGAHPSRADLRLPDDVPVILYPCRLVFQKQPPVFAKTLRELNRRGHRFLAVVAGDGPYRAWLESFVARHSLQHCVRFLGRQPTNRIRGVIAAADCVFLPSSSEGIAVVLFEAMAEGVPVVAADVGGQRELVTADCGVLVPRADEEAEVQRYADAIGELLVNPERRRAMGEAGRARIRAHFTLDMMGERMQDLLERAQQLAAAKPRRVPSAEEASAAALEAIRLVPWVPPGTPGVGLLLPEPEGAPAERTGAAPPVVFDLLLSTVGKTEEPRRFLQALEAQSCPHFRLIVVDQNADDRLNDVLAGFKPYPILHLPAEPGSDSRIVGLRHVDADVVAFPDDGCWYPPDLLERVAGLLAEHPEWDGLSVRLVDENGVTLSNVWSRADAYTVFLRGSSVDGTAWFNETMGSGMELGRHVHYEPSLFVRSTRRT